MQLDEKVRVFRTGDEVELRALADHLAEQGVDVHSVGESMVSGPYGVLGVDLTSNLEIWTSASDSRRARKLIAEWNQVHHPERARLLRRPLRYSLKSLLLLMTGVAVVCAILSAMGLRWLAFALGIFELVLIMVCSLAYLRRLRGADDQSRDPQLSATPGAVDGESIDG